MLIRLIGVRFSQLVGGSQQLDLFEDTPEQTSLYQAMDSIRLRYGKKAVRRAVGVKEKVRDTAYEIQLNEPTTSPLHPAPRNSHPATPTP